MEKQYTKDQILEAYLNTVYFGNGAYGVQAAANTYFNADVSNLTVPEAALLAGLIQNPNGYDPILDPGPARTRRAEVLARMVHYGTITQAQADAANATPLPTAVTVPGAPSPDATNNDYVREVENELLGSNSPLGGSYTERYNALFEGGLKIYTNLDSSMQSVAEQKSAAGHAHQQQGVRGGGGDHRVGHRQGAGPRRRRQQLAVRHHHPGHPPARLRVQALHPARRPGEGLQPDRHHQWQLAVRHRLPDRPRPRQRPGPQRRGPRRWGAEPARGHRPVDQLRLHPPGARGRAAGAWRRWPTGWGSPRTSRCSRRSSSVRSPCTPWRWRPPTPPCRPTGSTTSRPSSITSSTGRGRPSTPGLIPATGSSPPRWPAGHPGLHRRPDQRHRRAGKGLETGRRRARPGTTENSDDAWFNGYTPRLETTVWMGAADGEKPMTDVGGLSSVFGGTFPATTWQDIMSSIVASQPVQYFDNPDAGGPSKYIDSAQLQKDDHSAGSAAYYNNGSNGYGYNGYQRQQQHEVAHREPRLSSPALDALLALQATDTDIDRHRHRREALPDKQEAAEVDRRLDVLDRDQADVGGTLAEIVAREDVLEADLAATESRIDEVNRRLYGGQVAASRDLQAMAADVKALQARRSDLEDRVLAVARRAGAP